ncbi:MAG: glycosyltransferase family 4 protein [Clostridia bacterium]|jgi:glycosyltransferase involved in cell wall biosynthesis|nr:glycosyltransferase family 4 protein [Clostridia bacterium]
MNIMFLTGGGDYAGAKTHLLNITKELKDNVNLNVVCFNDGEFYRAAKDMEIPVTLIDQKVRFDISVLIDLYKAIREHKPDIIHCHGAKPNWWMFFIRFFSRAKSVTTIHSDYRRDFEDNKYKHIYYTFLNSFALRFFKNFIAVSDEFKDMLEQRGFGKKNIYVIYNCINEKDVKIEGISREEALTRRNMDVGLAKKKCVGILARLEKVKGVDVFINGAEELLKMRDDVHFFIAGDGTQRKELEKLIESKGLNENITMIGFTHKPFDFINILDVNTLTSHSESFPYSLLEGAMLKKRTVAANVGGVKNLIKDDETGELFKAGDAKDFAKKVDRVLNSDTNYGENLYKYTKENFSEKAMLKMHMDIYSSILEGKDGKK